MKKKSLVMFALGAVLFTGSAVSAQTVTPSPVPTGKFGEEVRELRDKNQEERKILMDQNKEERDDLKEQNKTSREQFRTNTKNLMISKTPEERKALRPTIVQERKDLLQKNAESRKTLRESIQAKMDTFRQTVRTRWTALWNSFFGKK